jgi:glutamate carboxypeptidase
MLRRMFTLVVVVMFALALAPPAARAAVSKQERKVLEAIERRTPEAIELLRRMVVVSSGTMNLEGVREVGRITTAAFETLDFTARWVDGAAWERAGHLIVERKGAKGAPRVLLIGHLDTVFEKDSPFQAWERRDDSTTAGPGIADMKGGNMVIWLALRAMADAGVLDRAHVVAVFTGDEENPGAPIELARRDLIEAARGVDAAIGFEGGSHASAVVARRGTTYWTLKTRGRPSHSSQIFKPAVGSGSIYEAARILTAFHDSLGGEAFLTFNPGLVLGGTQVEFDDAATRGNAFGKRNVVAESTVVLGDLRALTPEQHDRAVARMQAIVARNLPQTSAEIDFHSKYPPLAPTEANRRLLSVYDQASRDLGFGPVAEFDPGGRGAADVSFVAGVAAAAMDGLGIMGEGEHTVAEVGDLRTLPTQAQRFAVMLMRLADALKRQGP